MGGVSLIQPLIFGMSKYQPIKFTGYYCRNFRRW